MKVPCAGGEGCKTPGKTVDPNKPGAYREVTGWEQVRAGGGANAIHRREETGKVLCQGCYRTMESGGTPPML